MAISERISRRVDEAVRKVETRFDDSTRETPEDAAHFSRVPITFYNSSAETMPPNGIGQVIDAGDIGNKVPYVIIDKPKSPAGKSYLVNEDRPIPSHGWGQGYLLGWVKIAYDSGTPAADDTFGPQAGQWTAVLNGTPGNLAIDGIYDAANQIAIAVLAAAGGGSGTTFFKALILSNLLPNDTPVNARVIDEDTNLPTDQIESVYDGSLASGAYQAGAILWVERGAKNRARGAACVNEMENP